MDLKHYFQTSNGFGILATADEEGHVDQALYARPHIVDDHSVIFVMGERLSHLNLKSNLFACYTFIEDAKAAKGKRLYLQKTHEESNIEMINQIIHDQPEIGHAQDDSEKFLVCFQVLRVRPLVGP